MRGAVEKKEKRRFCLAVNGTAVGASDLSEAVV